jgi:hypothetical protein
VGDEVVHFRFAKGFYEEGGRPLTDPLIQRTRITELSYVMAPWWHMLLAFTWKAGGGISKTGMQAYHAAYLLLLVLGSYLLGKHLFGRRAGLTGALLVSTMPLTIAFGILCYLEVPIAALSVWCLLFILKRRLILAGAVLGVMFLTKRNSYLLVPAFGLLAVLPELKELRISDGLRIALPALFISLPDFIFRYQDLGGIISRNPVITPLFPNPPLTYNFQPANFVHNPIVLPQYLGIAFCVLFLLYLFKLKEGTRKEEWFLLIPILTYLPLFAYAFWGWFSLRYIAPILPLACILFSRNLALAKGRWLGIIALVCMLQVAAASGYVVSKRRIHPGLEEAYRFVSERTPPDAIILHPGIVAEYIQRRTAWYSTNRFMVDLPYLFWKANEKEALEILDRYGITNIFCTKDRIYDDREIRHTGGYPRSFLEKLETFGSVERIFENPKAILWKVRRPASVK